ncbi:MAG: carbon-nitrogen hydrolase family protein, partial [Proteobacteria bacterium]|nr:carbon-nitrogen hydrolase family protein [Pseudomonadota bacterium]
DHWELLVRARALENACYVLAAAQVGEHGGRRRSWGRAMIVGPWGEVLAQCGDGPGVALAEVNPKGVAKSRRKLDSTGHARLLPGAWRKGL